MNNESSQYLYFFKGPFSTWHKSNFKLDGINYSSTKQYLMHQKALLFADKEIAKKILATNNPKEHKQLGISIKNFDKIYWNDHCIQFMFRACHAKFTQNKRLYDMLLNTAPAVLVEASEFDKIWGNGLNEDESKKTSTDKWPGTNWLGKTLTELRDFLLEEERIEREYASSQRKKVKL